jgi:hypothetical protein
MSSSLHPRCARLRRARRRAPPPPPPRLATGILLPLLVSWLLDACVYRSETIQCENGVRCPPGLVCAESHGVCGLAEKVTACIGFRDNASCYIAGVFGVCRQGLCGPMHCDSPSVCNDDNPCTDDVCNYQGTCEHEANTAPCDDGNFCNGPDQCQDMQCMNAGLEPPCSGNTVCDEELQSCVGCKGDEDCQGDSVTVWSECRQGAEVCATSGLRSRLEVSWTCNGARCEAQTVTRTEPCELPPPTGTACNDYDACTQDDQCTAAGQCVGQPFCDDHNACTRDGCGSECTHEPEPREFLCQGGNCDGAGTCLACPNAGQPCSNVGFGDCEAGILLCDESGNQQCYATGPKPSGTPCRDPRGLCDAQEFCDGTALECPRDAFVPDGTPCSPGLTCTGGQCQ